MARVVITGVDEAIKALENMEESTTEIFEEAIKAGAGIIAGEIRKRLEQNLKDTQSAAKNGKASDKKKSESTGALLESFGISPIRMSKDDNMNVKLGFNDYDDNHTPNMLKARVMESGSSTIRKRPFFRPGVNAGHFNALMASQQVIENGLLKKGKG